MPLIKSAKKKMRQDVRRRERNMALRTYLKNLKKKTLLAIGSEGAKKEEVVSAVNLFKSKVDKAVAQGIFKKNKSSRLKSNMDLLYKKTFNEMQK